LRVYFERLRLRRFRFRRVSWPKEWRNDCRWYNSLCRVLEGFDLACSWNVDVDARGSCTAQISTRPRYNTEGDYTGCVLTGMRGILKACHCRQVSVKFGKEKKSVTSEGVWCGRWGGVGGRGGRYLISRRKGEHLKFLRGWLEFRRGGLLWALRGD